MSFSTNAHLLFLLLMIHAHINDLQDVVVGCELQGTNVHLDVVVQKFLCKPANFLGPRGTPHQGLAVRLKKRQIIFASGFIVQSPKKKKKLPVWPYTCWHNSFTTWLAWNSRISYTRMTSSVYHRIQQYSQTSHFPLSWRLAVSPPFLSEPIFLHHLLYHPSGIFFKLVLQRFHHIVPATSYFTITFVFTCLHIQAPFISIYECYHSIHFNLSTLPCLHLCC